MEDRPRKLRKVSGCEVGDDGSAVDDDDGFEKDGSVMAVDHESEKNRSDGSVDGSVPVVNGHRLWGKDVDDLINDVYDKHHQRYHQNDDKPNGDDEPGEPNDVMGRLAHIITCRRNRNRDGKDVVEGNGSGKSRVYPKSIMAEAVAQLGLELKRSFALSTLKRGDEVVHSATRPNLFISPASDMYMLVGESYLLHSSPEPDRVVPLEPEDNVGCCFPNKQAEEFVALVGLKFVPGVTSATFKRLDDAVFTVPKPSVFKSPFYDLYFVFGETKIENYIKPVEKTPEEFEDLYYKDLERRFPPDDIEKLMDNFQIERREALDCLEDFEGDVSVALAEYSPNHEGLFDDLEYY